MAEVNGATAKPVNRVKAKVLSRLKANHAWLNKVEGSDPSSKLVQKTEEGTCSATIKEFPDSLDRAGLKDIAAEVGLKASIKSAIGDASLTVQKTLTEEPAEGWIDRLTGEEDEDEGEE